MAKQPIAEKALYEQEEQQIQEKSDAFIRILTQRGILGNDQIKDERIRQAQQEKQRRMYHNTWNNTGISHGRWNVSQIRLLRNWITRWGIWTLCSERWIWKWVLGTANWRVVWKA